MKYNYFLIYLFIFNLSSVFALEPLLPPSSNFDLSAWKVQTLDDNLNVVNILSPELTNGYSTQFFYTDNSDGSLVFKVPSNGDAITGATGYPRVELRQMTGGANWKLTDQNEHFLTAECKVISVASVKPQQIIGQIHGSENESEMLKLRWVGYKPGQCYVDARFELNDASRTEYGVTLASGLSLGDLINYTITMKSGTITVMVNGNSASQTYTSEFFGTTDAYYLKAGIYIQYNNVAVNDPNIYIGQIQFYKISLIKQESTEIATTDFQHFSIGYAPNSKQISVRYELSTLNNLNLVIYSLNGKLVKILNLNKNENSNYQYQTFSVPDLSPGTYILKLFSKKFFQTRTISIN